MSDTIIKGKKTATPTPSGEDPKLDQETEQAPEPQPAGAAAVSLGGFDEKEFKRQRQDHFASTIYLELIRTRAESGFFDREKLKGSDALVTEVVHFRNVADVAAKAFFENK